jgi:hypothetical protein
MSVNQLTFPRKILVAQPAPASRGTPQLANFVETPSGATRKWSTKIFNHLIRTGDATAVSVAV